MDSEIKLWRSKTIKTDFENLKLIFKENNIENNGSARWNKLKERAHINLFSKEPGPACCLTAYQGGVTMARHHICSCKLKKQANVNTQTGTVTLRTKAMDSPTCITLKTT